MALRDNIYQQFGPVLIEALFDTTLEEINELRTKLSLPPIPKEEFLGRVHNNLNHLEPYDWMEGES